MDESSYSSLLTQLMESTDSSSLKSLIERNLTRFDEAFLKFLIVQKLKVLNRDQLNRLKELQQHINILLERGDYRQAQFDEANPSNRKEVLLALMRRIQREEMDLDTAVTEARLKLPAYAENPASEDSVVDWLDLSLSIGYSQEPEALVTLAELLWQVAELCGVSEDTAVKPVVYTRAAQARQLEEQYEYRDALDIYKQIIRLIQKAKWSNFEISLLLNVGDLYLEKLGPPPYPNHLVQAEYYYNQAWQVAESAASELEQREVIEAEILLKLGRALTKQGRLQDGEAKLQACLPLAHSTTSTRPQQLPECLLALANVYEADANYQDARHYYQKAIDQAPNQVAKVDVMLQLVAMEGRAGGDASTILTEAIQLVDQLNELQPMHYLRSRAYGLLAARQVRMGNLQSALDAYQTAIQAAIADNNEDMAAEWLSNTGQIYILLGQFDRAYAVFQQAAEIHDRFHNHLASANLMANLGHLLFRAEQLNLAAEAWSIAFADFYKAQKITEMVGAVLYLTNVYQNLGDFERAIACLSYCLNRVPDSPRLKGWALARLTELQIEQSQFTEALDTSKKAIAAGHETGELLIELLMRVHRGELLEKQLSLGAAEQEYRQAVELIEAMRGQLRNSEHRIQLQGRLSPPYEPLVRLLCGQTTNPRAIGEAFSFAERARSRTLVELLSRTEIRPPTTLPSSLVVREAQLLEQLLQIEESENFGVELAQQHQQLNQELKELWDGMELIDEDCRDYVALRRTPAMDIQEILELLRD